MNEFYELFINNYEFSSMIEKGNVTLWLCIYR
jgi:hypothetical protein